MKNKINKKQMIYIFSSILIFVFLGKQIQHYFEEKEIIDTGRKTELVQQISATATVENNKTKYSDGRFTAVRNLRYYNDLIKTGIPMKDAKFGLTTIMTEWNSYDANVASPQGGFIEKPMFLNEAEKKEMREAGVDQSDTLSAMVGGDEETNRRFVEPSKRYWAVASKMFEQEFANLTKAEGISDRTVDYVTFDFITTDGFYTVQVKKSELESGKSVWSKVFEESKFLNVEMARVQNESAMDDQKRNEARQLKKTQKVIDPKTNMENTKYSDGRTSEVRTESYYANSIKTLDANTDLKLFFFVMEYNDYEAVISDKEGVFGQLPNNTMTQIKKNVAGQNFFIFVDTVFQKNLNLLTLMTTVTDRSLDTVSFDFVTNKGVYTVQESKINLEKETSVWSELYKKAKEAKPKN
jgi:endonuclease V-like protein UPF0215 family